MNKRMQIGLGETIKRVNNLHSRRVRKLTSTEEDSDLIMLMEALNRIRIDLGFSCEDGEETEDINIFKKSSKTQCCTLVDLPGDMVAEGKKEKKAFAGWED